MDFLCKNTLNVADFLKVISSGLNLYWMPTRETDTSLMPKLRVLTVGERVLKISTYIPAVWSLLCTDDNVSPGTEHNAHRLVAKSSWYHTEDNTLDYTYIISISQRATDD